MACEPDIEMARLLVNHHLGYEASRLISSLPDGCLMGLESGKKNGLNLEISKRQKKPPPRIRNVYGIYKSKHEWQGC